MRRTVAWGANSKPHQACWLALLCRYVPAQPVKCHPRCQAQPHSLPGMALSARDCTAYPADSKTWPAQTAVDGQYTPETTARHCLSLRMAQRATSALSARAQLRSECCRGPPQVRPNPAVPVFGTAMAHHTEFSALRDLHCN